MPLWHTLLFLCSPPRNQQAGDAPGSWPGPTLCKRWVCGFRCWVRHALHMASAAHWMCHRSPVVACLAVRGWVGWASTCGLLPITQPLYCSISYKSLMGWWLPAAALTGLSVVPAAAAVPEVYKEGADPEIQAYQAHQKTAARPTSAEDARTLLKLAK